jgi:hypothetical protein
MSVEWKVLCTASTQLLKGGMEEEIWFIDKNYCRF